MCKGGGGGAKDDEKKIAKPELVTLFCTSFSLIPPLFASFLHVGKGGGRIFALLGLLIYGRRTDD